MVEEAGELIVGIAVECDGRALANDLHLRPEGSGVLLACVRIDHVFLLLRFLVDLGNFPLDLGKLLALQPAIGPIFVSDSAL